MKYDFELLFKTYSIQYWTSGNNVSDGWVNVRCPMCDDHSNHGGFSPEGQYNCWRCGGHSLHSVIRALTGKEWSSIRSHYETIGSIGIAQKSKRRGSGASQITLPYGTGPLHTAHRRYLEQRRFDPDQLVSLYGIQATSHLGEYKFRIIIPIYHQGQLVSYQGRDWTGKNDLRYKSCPLDKEIIHYKDLLYGEDLVIGDRVVVVEGVTDQWRLGPGSVATFGLGYTREQVQRLSEYSTVFILYDGGEEAARNRAVSMGQLLSAAGVVVEMILIPSGDPADLSQTDANKIMKDLLGGSR